MDCTWQTHNRSVRKALRLLEKRESRQALYLVGNHGAADELSKVVGFWFLLRIKSGGDESRPAVTFRQLRYVPSKPVRLWVLSPDWGCTTNRSRTDLRHSCLVTPL